MSCKNCTILRHLLKAIYDLVCFGRGDPVEPCEPPTPEPTPDQPSLVLSAKFSNGTTVQGTNMLIASRVDEKIVLTPTFTDRGGNVVTEFGSTPAWTIDDESLATLEAAVDGLTATVTPTGKLGTTNIHLTVDADPDEDYEEVKASVEVTFKAGKAVFAQLVATIGDLVQGPGPVIEVPTDPVPAPEPEPTPEPTPVEEVPVEQPVTEEPAPVEEPGEIFEPAPVDEVPAEEPVAEEPVNEVPPVEDDGVADPIEEPTEPEPAPAPVEEAPVAEPFPGETEPVEPVPVDLPVEELKEEEKKEGDAA